MRENYLYRGVKGMRDVFPEESAKMQQLEAQARNCFACYGVGEIRTPLVEHTVLFERGVGQGTDIVNKEMFYVPAKEDDADTSGDVNRKMVLRPEATASVVRAYIEHEIDKAQPGIQRYYYIGPMFRYERPQRGRYRQFTQIGVELLGSAQPTVDAEAVILLFDLLAEFGVANLNLQINAVGCPQCRPHYLQKLKTYAQAQANSLCPDCQNRLEKNTLRLFDCKKEVCRRLLAQAPLLQADLCPSCRAHQTAVLDVLTKAGIPYQLEPRLMRGLDYYTKTVFEVISRDLGAQNAVAAGGRYDNLVSELEGPETPAVGWSIGLERILDLLVNKAWVHTGLDIFVVANGPDPVVTFLQVVALRRQGLRVGMEGESRSIKALIKKADRLGARYALFVSESDPDKVEIKNMTTGEQVASHWGAITEFVATRAKS